MSLNLPPSLLRQNCSRFAQRAISRQEYRAKRTLILIKIQSRPAPVDEREPMPPPPVVTLFDRIPKYKFPKYKFPKFGYPRIGRHHFTPRRIIFLSVLSITAALMSLLPNARATFAAIALDFPPNTAVVATTNRAQRAGSPASAFQEFAVQLVKNRSWRTEQIDQVLDLWSRLDSAQRYSARRYTSYINLLSDSIERATEFRELVEVSTLGESLLAKARQIDRISKALLNR